MESTRGKRRVIGKTVITEKEVFESPMTSHYIERTKRLEEINYKVGNIVVCLIVAFENDKHIYEYILTSNNVLIVRDHESGMLITVYIADKEQLQSIFGGFAIATGTQPKKKRKKVRKRNSRANGNNKSCKRCSCYDCCNCNNICEL